MVVCMLQSSGALCDVIRDNPVGQRPMLFHQDLQVGTFDVFHNDVMSVLLIIDIVGPDDVRMVEAGDRFGFSLESF